MTTIRLQRRASSRVVLRFKRLLRCEVGVGTPDTLFGTADGVGGDAICSPVGKLRIVVAAQNVDVTNDEVVGLRCAIRATVEAQCGVDFLGRDRGGEQCRKTCG